MYSLSSVVQLIPICLCLFNTIVGEICILNFSSDYFIDIIIKILIMYPEMSLKLFVFF